MKKCPDQRGAPTIQHILRNLFVTPYYSPVVVRYEEAVKNSLLEVEDLLGSFNLSPIKKPLPPQTTPTKHTSTEVKGVNEFAEEVEVPLYDSDSLPSPPSSEGGSSEANSQELDELLDFTRDDEFNYNPAFEPDFTKEGMEGPRMMKAMFQAKHGIEVGPHNHGIEIG